MHSSGNKTSRKSLSGIMSCLLCSGSLPTHPSEQLAESSIEKFGDQKPTKCKEPDSDVKQVGVVARLMGLESLPSNSKERTLGDFFRSKSVNSVDFLSHFDLIKPGNHHHRRVRTSVSFREEIYDDFKSIILRLDEDDEEEELRRRNREYFQGRQVANRPGNCLEVEDKRKTVSPGTGPGDLATQKKNFKGKIRVDLKEIKTIVKGENCKEQMVGSKCVKKKSMVHKVHCKNKIHPVGSAAVIARGPSPRKPPPSRAAQSQSPYPSTANSPNLEARAFIITGKNDDRKTKIKESCYYQRMAEEICMLSDEDVRENWNLGMALKFEDVEEMCQQIGQDILEALLIELVDERLLIRTFWDKE